MAELLAPQDHWIRYALPSMRVPMRFIWEERDLMPVNLLII